MEEKDELEISASNLLVLIASIHNIDTDNARDETAKHQALGHLHLAYAALNFLWETNN